MDLAVVFEPVAEAGFPRGYYYAHMPTLGLTTHGEGIEGARAAARDLVRLWLDEKQAAGEAIPTTSEVVFATLHVPDHALQST